MERDDEDRPVKLKTLNGPASAPVGPMHTRFIQPALGPASRIQPTAPRYGGMMKVAEHRQPDRTAARHVGARTAQASGTAKMVASAAAAPIRAC